MNSCNYDIITSGRAIHPRREKLSVEGPRGLPLFSAVRVGHSNHIGAEGHSPRATRPTREKQTMRKEYDFSKLKGRKNPYARRLKKQITIRVGVDILEYFKELAEETGIPYQSLINLYLRDCVAHNRRPDLSW